MFLLYFHEFYLRSLKAEKGVKFLPPTKLEKKIIRPRLNFCPKTGTCPPISTSPNWHFFELFFCAIENLSHQSADTPLPNTEGWLQFEGKKV